MFCQGLLSQASLSIKRECLSVNLVLRRKDTKREGKYGRNGLNGRNGRNGLDKTLPSSHLSFIIHYQLSTVNYQLSTVNYQLSTVNYQLSTVNYQLSIINYQLSTINCQLSTVNYPFPLHPDELHVRHFGSHEEAVKFTELLGKVADHEVRHCRFGARVQHAFG